MKPEDDLSIGNNMAIPLSSSEGDTSGGLQSLVEADLPDNPSPEEDVDLVKNALPEEDNAQLPVLALKPESERLAPDQSNRSVARFPILNQRNRSGIYRASSAPNWRTAQSKLKRKRGNFLIALVIILFLVIIASFHPYLALLLPENTATHTHDANLAKGGAEKGKTPVPTLLPTPRSSRRPTKGPTQKPTPGPTVGSTGKPKTQGSAASSSGGSNKPSGSVAVSPQQVPSRSGSTTQTQTSTTQTQQQPPPPLPVPPPPPPPPPPVPQSYLTLGYQEYNNSTFLPAVGTIDWEQWGLNGAGSVNRKAGVSPQISNYLLVGGGPVVVDHYNPIDFGWSGGTPVASISTTTSGIYTSGNGHGFSLIIPASSTTRTLRVYVGVYLARGELIATLGGKTVSDQELNTLNDPANKGDNALYTITFNANTTENLTVTYIVNASNSSQGSALLEAAALS